MDILCHNLNLRMRTHQLVAAKYLAQILLENEIKLLQIASILLNEVNSLLLVR